MRNMNQGIRGRKSSLSQGTQKVQTILTKDAPFPYIEAYKTLRTNLDFVSSANGIKSILVTSAIPEETKSTTAINLAITLAESNYSVIVVECDLRKPTLRKYLKLERGKKGLSSLLSAGLAPDECIVNVDSLGISVIHAGTVPPNPSELLNQERMRELIEVLKQSYDYVILDAPPITVVTDAAIVGRMADGALLVVRSRFAPTKTIRLAKERLQAVNVKVLGAVITCFDVKKSGWKSGYDYERYEYGYGQIWSRK